MNKTLITGCPRSGTRYIHNVLNRVGVKVGHECIKEEGCSSGFYVGDFDSYPVAHEQPVSSIHWTSIIHLVRHPRRAVPSLKRLLMDVAAVRRWYEQFGLITGDLDESAMNVWYWSHKQTRQNLNVDLTVNIEWLPDQWNEVCNLVGIDVDFPYRVRIDNSYPYLDELSWEDLENINHEKKVQIEKLWMDLIKSQSKG